MDIFYTLQLTGSMFLVYSYLDGSIDVLIVLVTGRAFFTVRSGSLDSISTSVSLATQQSGPAHSSSLDNLYGSSRPRVEDRRRYVLLETGSVSSSRTADVDEQRGSESTLTRSLPAAMDRSVQCSSPRASGRVENTLDPDGFSDNFVTADDEGEARLTPRVSSNFRRY